MNSKKERIFNKTSPLIENINLINNETFIFLKEKGIILNDSYNDDEWILFYYFLKNKIRICFNIDNNFYKINDYTKNSLKSWLLFLLGKNYNPATAKAKIYNIIEQIKYTNGFSQNMINNMVNFDADNQPTTKKRKFVNLLEFLDFSGLEIPDGYYEIVYSFVSRKYRDKSKILPKSKDVLKFNIIVDDFFENKASTKDFIIFFPILLWWKLTNIIPMRISEFCYIQIDALIKLDGSSYLSIPRSKQMLSREIKYDKLVISKKLTSFIEKYLELTIEFKERETLISYQAYRALLDINTPKAAYDFSYYSNLFQSLLNKFYREIVFGDYDYSLNTDADSINYLGNKNIIDKIISPNDTRYFAFINLMLQGYHPIEIANLGGHNSLNAQIGYYNHIEHWIDSDIMNLYYLNQGLYNDMEINFNKRFEIEKKIMPSILISKDSIPLEIGYCTDLKQNCEVDSHFVCPYWRITPEDYYKYEDLIHLEITKSEDTIKAIFKNLIELHQSSIFNNKDERLDEKNVNYNFKIKNNAKLIKDALHKLSVLRSNLENV